MEYVFLHELVEILVLKQIAKKKGISFTEAYEKYYDYESYESKECDPKKCKKAKKEQIFAHIEGLRIETMLTGYTRDSVLYGPKYLNSTLTAIQFYKNGIPVFIEIRHSKTYKLNGDDPNSSDRIKMGKMKYYHLGFETGKKMKEKYYDKRNHP